MADLAKLRALHEAATPGPWKWSENGNILGHMPDGYDVTREVCAVYTDDEATGSPNAPLIIAMFNALPDLIAELTRLLAIAEAVERAPVWFVDYEGERQIELVKFDTGEKRVRLLAIGEDG